MRTLKIITPLLLLATLMANTSAQNKALIDKYNNVSVSFVDEKRLEEKKDAKILYSRLSIGRESCLESKDMRITLQSGSYLDAVKNGEKHELNHLGWIYDYALEPEFTNLTEDTLYIDLSKSKFLRDDEEESYYDPVRQNSLKYYGVNVDDIISIASLGNKGALTITKDLLTTEQNDSIITDVYIKVPPHKSVTLEPKYYYPGNGEKTGKGISIKKIIKAETTGSFWIPDLKWGDSVEYTEDDSPIKFGLDICFGRNTKEKRHVLIKLYISQFIGIPKDSSMPTGQLANIRVLSANYSKSLYLLMKNVRPDKKSIF